MIEAASLRPRPVSSFADWLRRGPFRQRASVLVGEIIVGLVILMAIVGPLLAPFDPTLPNPAVRLEPPGPQYLFGTDELGRDIFSRILHGARLSMVSSAAVLGLSASIGILVGLVAGYFRGSLEEVLMRLTDLFLSFPPIILAMALVAAMGPSLMTAMIAVAIVWWPRYARLVRGQVLAVAVRPYVEAAQAVGASTPRLLFRHILPNALDAVLVRATVDAGYIILVTASLSFIGLGAVPPTPEWGAMVASGRKFLMSQWWVPTIPGLWIFLTVLGLTLVGDELRDWLDPSLRTLREP